MINNAGNTGMAPKKARTPSEKAESMSGRVVWGQSRAVAMARWGMEASPIQGAV